MLVSVLAWHFVILIFVDRFSLVVLISGDSGEAVLQILSQIRIRLHHRGLLRIQAVLATALRRLMLPRQRRLLLLNIRKS